MQRLADFTLEIQPIRIPEPHKKPGVCYAVTDDGIELPIIDVSHPAFSVDMPGDIAERLVSTAPGACGYPISVQTKKPESGM